jgi:outer membrane receptor protein involved in Fe transport
MKTITLILFLILGINVFAQTGSSAPKFIIEKGSIKGVVKENTNKAALEYANIKLYSLPDSALITGAITTQDGIFEIKDIPLGKYYVVAEFIGYKKFIIPNLEITKEQKNVDCGEIILEPSAVELSEATVTADKNLVQYQIDKKVVNIDKKITASGGNLVDALENTPSVQVDAEGNVTLRGSSNFTVLIDGKPTALSGNDALKQIPASAVANVEVITNPSAKYDPDGSAGILNIIMKKEFKEGMNGILNAAVGNYFQHNGDFNFNFRREKVNFFIAGNYADRRRYPSTEIHNEMIIDDTTYIVNQTADRKQLNKSWSIKGGMDLYLNPNSTLTFSSEYGYFGFDMSMPAKSMATTNPTTDMTYYVDKSSLEIGGNYINSNLNYEQKFNDKGHKISAGLTYSNWDGTVNTGNELDSTNSQWLNPFSQNRYRTLQNSQENEYRGKIDYTNPVSEKITIEAGYQGRFKNVKSDYKKENYLFGSDAWNQDMQFDNGLNFTQNIQSAYFTISGKIIGVDVKAGLRGEYAERLLEVVAKNDKYTLDKFDLYPTLHLSKKLGETREMQLSYSRKVNRPDEWDLNPLPIFSSSNYSQAGNPNLKPEYVDSYEFNFMQHLKKGFVSLETYYRQTNNAIEERMSLDTTTNTVIVGSDNNKRNFAYGAELSGNLTLTKWLSVYASANVYSYNVSGFVDNIYVSTENLASDFVLNTNFTLGKSTRLQVTGFYNAPKVTSQGNESEMYGINTALRQEFMKKKLAVSLRVNDVFKTMKYKFVADIPNNSTHFTFKMDSPTVMLSLSYTLNNYKKRADDEGTEQNIGGKGLF